MSLMAPILNMWLRLTEKPHLTRAKDAETLRRSFETKAKLFFHAPRGTVRRDDHIAEIPVRYLHSGADKGPLILYLHGGGYVFGSPRTHDAMVATLCKKAGARAILPDYRKAPEHQHPAPLEDALTVYRALLDSGEDPSQIIIGGDSAGGGLALALIAEILKLGLPNPAGAFAFSPLTDMTYSGFSVKQNANSDVVLPASRVLEMTEAFIGDGPRDDPRASPLFAEFTGAPYIWLVASDKEILFDDTVRMVERLVAQNVDVDIYFEHNLPHVWPLFHNLLPEAHRTLDTLAEWITQRATGESGN